MFLYMWWFLCLRLGGASCHRKWEKGEVIYWNMRTLVEIQSCVFVQFFYLYCAILLFGYSGVRLLHWQWVWAHHHAEEWICCQSNSFQMVFVVWWIRSWLYFFAFIFHLSMIFKKIPCRAELPVRFTDAYQHSLLDFSPDLLWMMLLKFAPNNFKFWFII